MTYHEATAKKIHYSKLDPSLGFAFLIRSSRDFQKFKTFLENGKKSHGSSWVFNVLPTKPDYMKSSNQPRVSIPGARNNSYDFEEVDLNPNNSQQNRQTFEQFRKVDAKLSEAKPQPDDDFELL